ncbi:Gfo/Idh/MocA family protein [Bacillus sp. SD088]|uniref:Gfo/Idh/MocA family protein n=1 Tax=Bacillus sp. SD088 TaxID=2782012 RepID=UPI001A97CD51|nr:Gfo/Idh/MocA family oxidoreductase [Bacillus sp. SD088]MBO0992120.1 Gfo/Idh/MocA family oxidoreductase [Bacillus sp. SD088]
MEAIKVAIIGVGLIGKQHIKNYLDINNVEIIAVCDLDRNEAKEVAQKFNIPHVYSDYKEMLKRDDIHAVDVCLHNNLHSAITIEAFQAGKHVYCEKPIAGTYFDGKAMVEAAKEYGKLLHIQLRSIFRSDTKAAKALINEGMLGNIYHARSTGFRRRGRPFVDGYGTPAFTRKESAGGGALFDMGVYHIAQILYLLDLPKVDRITGKLYQEMPMDRHRQEQSGFNVEEMGLGFIRFHGGLTLDIIEAWSVHLNQFEGPSIVGSSGGIRLPAYPGEFSKKDFSFHSTIADIDFDSTPDLERMEIRRHSLNENEDAYDSPQHHWIAALQNRVELLPTAAIALQTMLISEGIYLSNALGREVSVDEVINQSKSTSIFR